MAPQKVDIREGERGGRLGTHFFKDPVWIRFWEFRTCFLHFIAKQLWATPQPRNISYVSENEINRAPQQLRVDKEEFKMKGVQTLCSVKWTFTKNQIPRQN